MGHLPNKGTMSRRPPGTAGELLSHAHTEAGKGGGKDPGHLARALRPLWRSAPGSLRAAELPSHGHVILRPGVSPTGSVPSRVVAASQADPQTFSAAGFATARRRTPSGVLWWVTHQSHVVRPRHGTSLCHGTTWMSLGRRFNRALSEISRPPFQTREGRRGGEPTDTGSRGWGPGSASHGPPWDVPRLQDETTGAPPPACVRFGEPAHGRAGPPSPALTPRWLRGGCGQKQGKSAGPERAPGLPKPLGAVRSFSRSPFPCTLCVGPIEGLTGHSPAPRRPVPLYKDLAPRQLGRHPNK